MKFPDELIRHIVEGAPPVFLAVMGGVVHMFQSQKQFSWVWVSGGLLMSAFVGILVYLLMAEAPVSANVRAAMCGVSGYSSAQILRLIEKLVLRRVSERMEGRG